MPRKKEEKKQLTPADRARLADLEAESDRLLDELFDDPGNRRLLDRLNQLDVAYVRLSGDKALLDNIGKSL